jgi:hypothetical protein
VAPITDVGDGRLRVAATQLLSRNAISGWEVVWRAVEANAAFANDLFSTLALDQYSRLTSDLVRDLRVDRLADMYIWLAEHGAAARQEYRFGVITPANALVWLGRVVLTQLGDRGTAATSAEIRRIQERLPGEPFDFISKATDELVRRNTGRPLSLAQLIPFKGSDDAPSIRDGDKTPAETEKHLLPIREWNDLAISFTSDERVTVKFTGADAETRSYEEMGFANGRGGKPSLAWIALRELSSGPGKSKGMDKKREQDIRKRLRKFSPIDANPLLFEKTARIQYPVQA